MQRHTMSLGWVKIIWHVLKIPWPPSASLWPLHGFEARVVAAWLSDFTCELQLKMTDDPDLPLLSVCMQLGNDMLLVKGIHSSCSWILSFFCWGTPLENGSMLAEDPLFGMRSAHDGSEWPLFGFLLEAQRTSNSERALPLSCPAKDTCYLVYP